MATVGITLGYRAGEKVPVLRGEVTDSEAITSSGTSQQSTATANSTDQYWRIAVSGGAIWVSFGSDPTAAAGTDYLLPDGGSIEVEAAAAQKAAVIDA